MKKQDLTTLMIHFRTDVTEATSALIYILYGINLIHRQVDGEPPNTFPVPDYPKLKVLPRVIGNAPFSDRTAPNGPIEQLAFKAWFTEVYDHLWEHTYRTELTRLFRETAPNAIRPEADVMGDLGKIRNDLVHIGTARKCSNCKILRWFKADDQMHMRLWHVLDFLNQMGWISDEPCIIGDRGFMWRKSGDTVDLPSDPRIVSVRPLLFGAEEFEYSNAISVVFEDGIHANVPVDLTDATPISDQEWMDMHVDKRGDIIITPAHTIRSKELYPACLGPKTKGPGVYSPAFKFTR